jgi:hypothetical protein
MKRLQQGAPVPPPLAVDVGFHEEDSGISRESTTRTIKMSVQSETMETFQDSCGDGLADHTMEEHSANGGDLTKVNEEQK